MIGTHEMDDLPSRLMAFGDALAFDDAQLSGRWSTAARRGREAEVHPSTLAGRGDDRRHNGAGQRSRSTPTAVTPWHVGWVSKA